MSGEGLWLPLADLARERGISRQALGERVDRLVRLGHLETRPGPGRSRLVNAAAFDRAAGLTGDAVRTLNGGGRPASSSAGAASFVLSAEQARRAAYDADLKKLELDERLGQVLPIDDVKTACAEAAVVIVRFLDALPQRAPELLAAASGGMEGARAFLRNLRTELRQGAADAVAGIATSSGSSADQRGEPEDPG